MDRSDSLARLLGGSSATRAARISSFALRAFRAWGPPRASIRLRRGIHDSVEQLETAILDFIELHNRKEAKPFRWTPSPEHLIAARQRGTQLIGIGH